MFVRLVTAMQRFTEGNNGRIDRLENKLSVRRGSYLPEALA